MSKLEGTSHSCLEEMDIWHCQENVRNLKAKEAWYPCWNRITINHQISFQISEMSDMWNVGHLKCRTSEMSDKWNFGQVRCRTCEMSDKRDFHQNNISLIPQFSKIYVGQVRYQQFVGQVTCRTTGLSYKWENNQKTSHLSDNFFKVVGEMWCRTTEMSDKWVHPENKPKPLHCKN